MISIISLVLDILINRFINQDSLFIPLFTLVSILFIKNDKYYYIKLFLIGFLYDLLFTNYYVLNAFIYLIIGFINNMLLRIIDKNIIGYIFITIIDIFIYQLFLFLIFKIFRVNSYDLYDFIFIIKHYFLINILYLILIYNIKKKLHR